MLKVIFVEKDGNEKTVEAPLGLSLMEIAQKHSVDIEGACGGCLACATCHVVVEPKWFSQLTEKSEDEDDMLDLAFDLKRTSRLCCQILMTETLDGIRVALPGAPNPWENE